MKIRVEVPQSIMSCYGTSYSHQLEKFNDDILLWAMETDCDVSLYTTISISANGRRTKTFSVFSVLPEHSFLFMLKWGATQHKQKEKRK